MNTLARILSHGFAIVVVVILAVGFIYRGELFPDMDLAGSLALDTQSRTEAESASRQPAPGDAAPAVETTRDQGWGQPAADAASVMQEDATAAAMEKITPQESGEPPAVEEVAQQDSEQAPVAEEVVQPDRAAVPATGTTPESGHGEIAEIVAEAPEEAVTDAGTVDVITAEPAAGLLDQPEPSSVIVEEAPASTAEITMPPAGIAGKVDEPASATAPQIAPTDTQDITVAAEEPKTGVDTSVPDEPSISTLHETTNAYELLAAAREAYWLHDYAGAEANYLRLAAQEPENPDSYGELGNMYFTQGKWEQAADTYFEAGKRLVESGHIVEAQTLVNVIRGLNGSQADKLKKLIAAADSSGKQQ